MVHATEIFLLYTLSLYNIKSWYSRRVRPPVTYYSWVGENMDIVVFVCFLRLMLIERKIVSHRYPNVDVFPLQCFIYPEMYLTSWFFSFLSRSAVFIIQVPLHSMDTSPNLDWLVSYPFTVKGGYLEGLFYPKWPLYKPI